MRKRPFMLFLAFILGFSLLIGGCAGTAERERGLEPEAVVKTVFNAAKAKKLTQAAAYVAPSALVDDVSSVTKMLTGFGVEDIRTANLLSVKKVSTQGDFAVVVATIHQENTLKISVKTIGLEKIEDEWYIIPVDRIVQDTKYRLLADLLGDM